MPLPYSSAKSDPLAELRSKLKSGSLKPAPKTSPATPTAKPAATSQYTNLLLAIAHANGHSQPKMWAQQVTDYLATLK